MNFEQAACCLSKAADIPQVEAVIRLVNRFVTAEWEREMREAIKELERRLDSMTDRMGGQVVDDLIFLDETSKEVEIAAILAGLYWIIARRASTVLGDARSADRVYGAATTLTTDGARSEGLQAPLTQAEVLWAFEELRILLRGRIETQEAAIKAHLRTFLTSRGVRTVRGSLELGTGPDRAEWLTELRTMLGIDTVHVYLAVDTWAYRWFNNGVLLAGLREGAQEFEAVAVRDAATTTFCWWVHGRRISVSRVRRQLKDAQIASLNGDSAELFRVWPFVPWDVAAYGSAADFESWWPRLGLPPYHMRCRTRVQIVRRAG